MCPACPSNIGCKRNALGELPVFEAMTTSQTFLLPVGVSYKWDNTCKIKQNKKKNQVYEITGKKKK